jgi:hypothetical protein
MDPVDLTSIAARGNLWVLTSGPAVLGCFRVSGQSMRHVQVEDLVVRPPVRTPELDARLALAAAQVARLEYTGTAVVAAIESAAARAALEGAGYAETGVLEDVRLR